MLWRFIISTASVLLSTSRNSGGLSLRGRVGNGQILKGKQSMSTPPLPPTPRQTDTHQKRPSVFRNFSHPHSPLDCKADDVIMESSGTPLVLRVKPLLPVASPRSRVRAKSASNASGGQGRHCCFYYLARWRKANVYPSFSCLLLAYAASVPPRLPWQVV